VLHGFVEAGFLRLDVHLLVQTLLVVKVVQHVFFVVLEAELAAQLLYRIPNLMLMLLRENLEEIVYVNNFVVADGLLNNRIDIISDKGVQIPRVGVINLLFRFYLPDYENEVDRSKE